jgi:2-polyprenyl-3-methyl-5-hydroxy-6-metoxy-1,4-benzoquinol methylase
VFKQNGFAADNVIHANFFSDEFIVGHRERFDVVISRGFIEHCEDAKSVIDRYGQLLNSGGYLKMSIPNVNGTD